MVSLSEARRFLEDVRKMLAPLNEKILKHPFITDAEKGSLPFEKILSFIKNQYYIVSRDIKALAAMLSRAKNPDEEWFFQELLKGDIEAFKLLLKMAESLNLSREVLESYHPIPSAVAYTHFLASLALYSSAGEQAMAMVVNLPVWGANCSRLAKALKEKYGAREVSFLELFASPADWLEEAAVKVMEPYIDKERDKMLRAAKLIQAYEAMFWDGVYGEG
ncbi:MAG: TenA family transcriptional regulator [Candidatus Methanomethylicota archaeon]|uniref:TenA family transcriptional regulator n=1 Tax=Thermoproteota archaeon TaxID=2056631 RepID=A0A497F1M6_9CREN|nr:MAG: TenA family transcriptional regulator [Candidatus Verstraetearchaeota archaeon]RLE53385.1 MAG: TenA family transcriptional regulator [Candidatus Verstraetearchaeota archaeon]